MKKQVYLKGVPNPKQKALFLSRTKYTAYGGARGGGKSWAMRRKLVLMCVRYPGLKCLLIRRSYPELRYNHILPLCKEISHLAAYSDVNKCFTFKNGSTLKLGYLADDGDTLRYQGLEFDVIALDEATQLTEYQFSILKACLRGANGLPKRMYLTCNPGGVGHTWVKRLFVDREYRKGERPEDYSFIQATVYDNEALLESVGDYVSQLESLPEEMKKAWLYGSWDIFSGQFFPDFANKCVISDYILPKNARITAGLDYGFDMTALVLVASDERGDLTVYGEYFREGLTLSEAAERVAAACKGHRVDYIAASPDLWNRRQDTGLSGFEIMSRQANLPSLIPADDRRVAGWRAVREYIAGTQHSLKVTSQCKELIRCMSSLVYDKDRPEDASDTPHSITHLPEALRYAVMSRIAACESLEDERERKRRSYMDRFSVARY